MPGLLWLLLALTCVTAQNMPRGNSVSRELLVGSTIGKRSIKSQPFYSVAISSIQARPTRVLKDEQGSEGQQLLSNLPGQKQLRFTKRALGSAWYSKNGVGEPYESKKCGYICHNCYKVISLRLAALCSSQCRSNGYAFQACSIAWNQLRYILLPY